jgi:hypothetical protein
VIADEEDAAALVARLHQEVFDGSADEAVP